MSEDLKKQVEALLFSSGRKMSVDELKIHLSIGSTDVIIEVLNALKKEYDENQRAMMVINEGDSWKLAVREKHINLVRKINPNTELTKSMMETLAVIAWKQPITQSEVIAIRTNKAYDHITEIEKMGFLIKEKYGRTYMLKLTQKFFDYFDLRDAQSARDLFKHIKETEQTQQKLEEARAAVEEGVTMEQTEKKEEHALETTNNQGSKEDIIQEESQNEDKSEEDKHEEAVEEGEKEEELEDSQDRDEMVDEDEIDSEEAGFVEGYEDDADETQEHAAEEKKKEENE